MIERQAELQRRYKLKAKMKKLKAKLLGTTGEDRTAVLAKIKRVNPMWTEANLRPEEPAAAPAPDAAGEKKRGTAKPKAEKK